MRIHYLQHVPYEDPAGISDWLKANQHHVTGTQVFEEHTFPKSKDFDGLIIMGGPMSINDDKHYPWLSEEKHFIEAAITEEKLVLGICLGAQLIADVLGAAVYPNRYKEIGWFPVHFTRSIRNQKAFRFLPAKLSVFHWHGDTFDLPENGIQVAKSAGCPNQGFLYKEHVLALQFHLESTRRSVGDLITNNHNELGPGRYIQTPAAMLGQQNNFIENIRLLYRLLDHLIPPFEQERETPSRD